MRTYEEIAGLLDRLSPPSREGEFRVEWLEADRLAVGRDANERSSLFVAGPPLSTRFEIVGDALRHGKWRTTTGTDVDANLLQLPRGEAFRTAAAAIAAELFRRGIDKRPINDVFGEVEPFIALVLRRVLLPEEFILGLLGELVVLRELLLGLGAARHALTDPTGVWHGWQRQSRDFVLGPTSIEVKTTGLNVSRHTFSGFDQVEPRAADGEATEALYVLSIGLRRVVASGGLSISGLTESILSLLAEPETASTGSENEAQTKFLDRLALYGPEGFEGYRHRDMRDLEPYLQTFTTTFSPRAYDMRDTNIRIIRRADLAREFQCVLPTGVTYTAELPERVPGSIDNPKPDLDAFFRLAAASLIA